MVAKCCLLALVLPLADALHPQSSDETGPPFLYVLGVEGSNHHGVMSKLLYPLVAERCDRGPCDRVKPQPHGDHLPTLSSCPSFLRDEGFRDHLFALDEPALADDFRRGEEDGVWFMEDKSFPSGRGNRQVPSPIDLSAMFRIVSPLARLKFLVLQRSFMKTVMCRADYDETVEAHAWKIADYLEYLSTELQAIPMKHWKVLPVDCLGRGAEERELAKQRVAAFLGTKHQCCGCFRGWRESSDHGTDRVVDKIMGKTIDTWPVFNVQRESTPFLRQYLVHPTTCD